MNGTGRPSTLFLLSSLTIGGSEVKTVRLANDLVGRGHRIVLAYLNGPETLLDTILPAVRVVHLQRRGKFSVPALRSLMRLITEVEASSVVAVNLYPALYAVLAKMLSRSERPKVIATVNTSEFVTPASSRQMILYRHVLRRADQIVFGARAQQQAWVTRYRLGDAGRRSAVIYNGVDASRFSAAQVTPQRPAAWPASRFVIGSVGAFRKEKAQIDIVRAVARLCASGIDAGAIIVGDGPERAVIEDEIRRLDLAQRIVLPGSQQDVRPHLAAMNVFVLPSIAVETFSNAALEAMSMGLPVAATRIGGMEEMIQYGGGFVFNPGDVMELSERLAQLAGNAAELRAMSERARQSVTGHFDWNRMVENYQGLFQ